MWINTKFSKHFPQEKKKENRRDWEDYRFSKPLLFLCFLKIERQIYCESSKEILNFRADGENV